MHQRRRRGTGVTPVMPVRVPTDVQERLKAQAKVEGLTVSEFVRQSIVSTLELRELKAN